MIRSRLDHLALQLCRMAITLDAKRLHAESDVLLDVSYRLAQEAESVAPVEEDAPRTWFTADTHFGDNRIKRLSPYGFKMGQANEMDDHLVNQWNSVVRPQDTVYHVGDFASFKTPEELKAMRDRLNGKIHLTIGNWDEYTDRLPMLQQAGFDSITPESQINVPMANGQQQRVYLNHYPQASWDGHDTDAVHLYGHYHGFPARFPTDPKGMAKELKPGTYDPAHPPMTQANVHPRSIDVGHYAHGGRPISMERILHLMQNGPKPHEMKYTEKRPYDWTAIK